jgi:PAS domain S-box-containing protein
MPGMDGRTERRGFSPRHLADVAGGLDVAWGLLVLLGWTWHLAWVLAPGPSLAQASPDTAVVALCLGMALLGTGRLSRPWLRAFLAVAALLSGLNLLQVIVGMSFGVGPVAFRSLGGTPMSPNTALASLALSVALWRADRKSARLVSPSQGLALFGGAVGGFAVVGYLYGATGLIGVMAYTPVALPSALMLVSTAVGVHALVPDQGWIECLLSPRAGGVLLRRLLATVVLLPPVVGYLAVSGQRMGFFGNAFGYALVACIDAILIAWMLVATAASLNRSDTARLGEQLLREKLEQLGDAAVAISGAIIRSQQLELSENLQIRSDLNMQNIMQAIVDQAALVAEAEYAALGIGTDPHVPFCPWVFSGMAADMPSKIGRYPRPVGTLGLVAREGLVLRLDDLTRHEAFLGLPEGHPPVHSFLAVPIRYQGENVGNLYLGNKRGAAAFTIADQRAVELIVPHAAVALQQATLRATISTQRAHIDTILSAAPNGILFIDALTGAVSANARATGMMGVTLPEHQEVMRSLCLLHRPDGRTALSAEMPSNRALADETAIAEEWLIIRPDGRRLPVLVSAAPVRGVRDRIEGAVVVLQDISAWKALERTRDEYLSLISHDLRGPLAVIGLQATALRQSTDPKVVAKAEGIGDNVGRLTAMISDLVETTRLEAGTQRLVQLPALLPALVDRLLASGITEADRPHVHVDLAPDLPRVLMDTGRIERVLLNLIGNARKYAGPDWQVVIAARQADGQVEISVADNGRGFPPEDLPRLFEKYYRGRQTDKADGLGLGLYICRLIVEGHGGRIWAENMLQGGGVVHVRLPIARSETAQAA